MPYEFSLTELRRYVSGEGGGIECKECGNYARRKGVVEWIPESERGSFKRLRAKIECPNCGSGRVRRGMFVAPPEDMKESAIGYQKDGTDGDESEAVVTATQEDALIRIMKLFAIYMGIGIVFIGLCAVLLISYFIRTGA